jgi:hypothetical protein
VCLLVNHLFDGFLRHRHSVVRDDCGHT